MRKRQLKKNMKNTSTVKVITEKQRALLSVTSKRAFSLLGKQKATYIRSSIPTIQLVIA